MGLIKKFFSVTKEGIVAKTRKGAEKACTVMLNNAIKLGYMFMEEERMDSFYKQHFHSALIQGRPHWSMDFMGVLYNKGVETECGWWEGYHSELTNMDDFDGNTPEDSSDKVDSSIRFDFSVKLQSDDRPFSE